MKFIKGVLLTLVISLVLIPCIAALPTIVIDTDAVISGHFFSYIRAGMYFLPVGTVVTILGIQITLWVFRIVVSIVRAFWELLPFTF